MSDSAVRRIRVHTDNLDRSMQVLGELYTPVRADVPGGTRQAQFSVASHEVEGFRIDRLSHSSGYRLEAAAMDFVGVVMLTRGQATYTTPEADVRFAPGRSLAFPARTPLRVEHSAYEMRFVTVPAARLAAHAAELSGCPDLQLRLDLATTTSRADEARWRATVDYLQRELARLDTALDSPLFRENALLLLMDALLATFPSNFPMRAASPPAGSTSPRAVRRAIEFVEAHADRSVSAGEIAAAAGVRVSDLAEAFARERGVSPTAYLRQVRLQRAEEDLGLAAASGEDLRPDVIRGILTRWGFSTPQRYATLYRGAFAISSVHVTPTRSP